MKDVEKLDRRLREAGFEITKTHRRQHRRVKDGGKVITTYGGTPGVSHWEKTTLAYIKRAGHDLDADQKPARSAKTKSVDENDYEKTSPHEPLKTQPKEHYMRQQQLEDLRKAVKKGDKFAIGDISLALVPMQARGAKQSPELRAQLVKMADLAGIAQNALANCRYVADRFPAETRRTDVSWGIHFALAPHPERAAILHRQKSWTTSQAQKAALEGRTKRRYRKAGEVVVSHRDLATADSRPAPSDAAPSTPQLPIELPATNGTTSKADSLRGNEIRPHGVIVVKGEEPAVAAASAATALHEVFENLQRDLAVIQRTMNQLAFELGRAA